MKICKLLLPFLALVLLLSACGPATEASSAENSIEDVYTAAAMTVSFQGTAATTTSTLQPTATFTPQATATLISTLALAQTVAAPVAVVNPVSKCDSSVYISDVTIPDGTILAPGEAFSKTWRFQNSGTCAWTTSYSIVFVSGEAMSGSTTTFSASTNSGSTLDISVEMVAPSTTGTYTGYWKLQNASGTSFGETVYIQIIVSDVAATITPTTTPTDESADYTATPTPTIISATSTTIDPTSTTAPTATIALSDTPEPTAVPTETPDS